MTRFDYEFGNDGYYIIDKEKIEEYDESFTDKMEYREYTIENSLSGDEVVDLLNSLWGENEQLRQSIDSMIEKATEISNRNVLLHEEIGRQTRLNKELQQKLDWICEQTGYDGAKFKHIEKLKEKLREKEEDEKLYANEIVKLNKEVKDNQFLRLGNDY